MKALLVSILALLACSVLAAPPDDTLRRALPGPELYIKHLQTLALTDAQAATLRAAIETMNREFREQTPVLEERTRALAAAVEDAATPADEVQRRLDAVLEIESRMKASRLRVSLAARRMLTPEQWAKLASITGASEPTVAGAEPVREELHGKLARIRQLSAEVFPAGPPEDFRRRFNRAQNQMRAGNPGETARLFDEIISDLEKRLTANP
jgi:Spy/CpxP family protein refolding chaperone